jgi:hypothetical protein
MAAAIVVSVVAVVCCAGPLVVGGVLGGLSLGAVLGVGAGALGAASLAGGALVLARARRRRGCGARSVARSSAGTRR